MKPSKAERLRKVRLILPVPEEEVVDQMVEEVEVVEVEDQLETVQIELVEWIKVGEIEVKILFLLLQCNNLLVKASNQVLLLLQLVNYRTIYRRVNLYRMAFPVVMLSLKLWLPYLLVNCWIS
jgi:hypothetical protein